MTDPILPTEPLPTPCLLVLEDGLRHNLAATAAAAGGVQRLMPHVKTHRAPWVARLCLEQGVTAFKCASPAEVEMCLEAGAPSVTWAYPTPNPVLNARLAAAARRFPQAEVVGMVDSPAGLAAWQAVLAEDAPANLRLRVDLDPGLGRTGIAMGEGALDLARALAGMGRFAGWHVYDGPIKGGVAERRARVEATAETIRALDAALAPEGIAGDMIGGGSYTFNLWPQDVAARVSPGSWTYSSAEHDVTLAELGWQPSAFVLATVISVHAGTATLDAGAKAISPDKPLAERFRWPGRILMMNEEHTVVEAEGLSVGERVALLPQHACTTAYLYDRAYVRGHNGGWDWRPQLGSRR